MIPLPYQAVAAAVLAAFIFAGGVTSGYKWHKSKTDAAEVAALKAAESKRKELEAAYLTVSEHLVKDEVEINNRAVEVLKNVPKVTTGRPCLGNAAVRLLYPSDAGLKSPVDSAQPVAESAESFATDTDVGYWAAEANRLYDSCAAQHNGLIDAVTHE